MLLGAMLAMALVAAAPAIAQVSQGFEEEDVESGDVEPSVDITNAGDQVNMCAAILQSANTGNVQNQQGVSQYLAYADDIEFEGSSIEITPEAVNECTQVIEQAAAAAAAPAKAAAPAPAPAPAAAQAKAGGAEAKAAPAPAPAPAPAQAKAGGAQAKALPPTGGISPLLAVGGGAALLTGGLLVRRIIG
jgi:hypothetical protein